jgi:hypothetical protein
VCTTNGEARPRSIIWKLNWIKSIGLFDFRIFAKVVPVNLRLSSSLSVTSEIRHLDPAELDDMSDRISHF